MTCMQICRISFSLIFTVLFISFMANIAAKCAFYLLHSNGEIFPPQFSLKLFNLFYMNGISSLRLRLNAAIV